MTARWTRIFAGCALRSGAGATRTGPLYNSRMSVLRALPLTLVLPAVMAAQQTISFPTEDGGRICADLYGQGTRGVVLAHGGRFNKESWRDQAGALASEGFRVLAIDFRGFGCSTGPGEADFDDAPFENDVLAAVRYLKAHGVKTVSVVGGSFGGGAAGDASIKSVPGEIDRIVFLGAAPNLSAEKLKSRALFIVARDDANDAGPRLPGIRVQYEKAPQPKQLIIVDGSAHAQFLFQTDQSVQVMREIVRFLSMP
jgi:pimeloyl-ACP methyl ester carboxylesterase